MPAGAWTDDELRRIDEAEELELSSMRDDETLRDPVIMWVIRVGDDVYVRSVNGRDSSWLRAQIRHKAHISAGGIDKDIELVETDDRGDAVDAAYQVKYGGRYPTIVPTIVAPDARAATLKLTPG